MKTTRQTGINTDRQLTDKRQLDAERQTCRQTENTEIVRQIDRQTDIERVGEREGRMRTWDTG